MRLAGDVLWVLSLRRHRMGLDQGQVCDYTKDAGKQGGLSSFLFFYSRILKLSLRCVLLIALSYVVKHSCALKHE